MLLYFLYHLFALIFSVDEKRRIAVTRILFERLSRRRNNWRSRQKKVSNTVERLFSKKNEERCYRICSVASQIELQSL